MPGFSAFPTASQQLSNCSGCHCCCEYQIPSIIVELSFGLSSSSSSIGFSNIAFRIQLRVLIQTLLRLDQNVLLAALMKSGLEVCSVEVNTTDACLILSFGNSTSYVHATFKKSPITTSEDEAREAVKKACKGLHYFAIQEAWIQMLMLDSGCYWTYHPQLWLNGLLKLFVFISNCSKKASR